MRSGLLAERCAKLQLELGRAFTIEDLGPKKHRHTTLCSFKLGLRREFLERDSSSPPSIPKGCSQR